MIVNAIAVFLVVHAANIIKPTLTYLNREKYSCWVKKSLEHLKNLKNGLVLYVGLKLAKHVIKSKIHLVRRSF
jgi:hypothetical protein